MSVNPILHPYMPKIKRHLKAKERATARRAARDAIKDVIRRSGMKVASIPYTEITRCEKELTLQCEQELARGNPASANYRAKAKGQRA